MATMAEVSGNPSAGGEAERLMGELLVFMAPTLLTDRPLTVRWEVGG
jgi:hypothetical protein